MPLDVNFARNLILNQVRLAKDNVIGRMESGDRDWDELRRAVNLYIEMQTASDVLSGQITFKT